jgi:branched-chain amino acid transport system permease protein
MTLLIQTLASGVAAGAVYALIAVGFSLIYKTTRIINLAQGDLAILGGYLSYTYLRVGLPLPVALIAGVLSTGVAAAVIERVALRPLYKRPLAIPILCTVGIAVLLESTMQLIWGSLPLFLPPVASTTPWHVEGIAITPLQVVMFAIATASAIGLLLGIGRTRIGRAMRGCAEDAEVTSLFGVNPDRMYLLAFTVGGLLAGLAGILIVPTIGLLPSSGLNLSVIGFSAAVLGGLGSLPGAILGGVLISILVNVTEVYVSSNYAYGVVYLIMAVVLLVRVRGLLGDDLEAVRRI